MPFELRDAITLGVGFGDALTDLGFEYVDEATGRADKPVLKKPSTWLHIATSGVAGLVSYLYLRDYARTIGFMITGRHLGKVVGDVVSAYSKGKPVYSEKAPEFVLKEVELRVPSKPAGFVKEVMATPTPAPAEETISY